MTVWSEGPAGSVAVVPGRTAGGFLGDVSGGIRNIVGDQMSGSVLSFDGQRFRGCTVCPDCAQIFRSAGKS